MAASFFNRIGQVGLGVALLGGVVNSALYNVDGGHRAVIFDRFTGVKQEVTGEGTHFFIPWVQRPIIYDIRSQPRNVPVVTGSKDLQNVNITLRILYRPIPEQLPKMYTILGVDYDERVLPSITTEVLKAVVAQFDAGELITQREVRSFVEDSFLLHQIMLNMKFLQFPFADGLTKSLRGPYGACLAVRPNVGRHLHHTLDLWSGIHVSRRNEAGRPARSREGAFHCRKG